LQVIKLEMGGRQPNLDQIKPGNCERDKCTEPHIQTVAKWTRSGQNEVEPLASRRSLQLATIVGSQIYAPRNACITRFEVSLRLAGLPDTPLWAQGANDLVCIRPTLISNVSANRTFPIVAASPTKPYPVELADLIGVASKTRSAITLNSCVSRPNGGVELPTKSSADAN
jgi:hypothetical protein